MTEGVVRPISLSKKWAIEKNKRSDKNSKSFSGISDQMIK